MLPQVEGGRKWSVHIAVKGHNCQLLQPSSHHSFVAQTQEHKDYCQIQLSLLVKALDWADLVLSTPSELFIEHILRTNDLIASFGKKLDSLYMKHSLPALFVVSPEVHGFVKGKQLLLFRTHWVHFQDFCNFPHQKAVHKRTCSLQKAHWHEDWQLTPFLSHLFLNRQSMKGDWSAQLWLSATPLPDMSSWHGPQSTQPNLMMPSIFSDSQAKLARIRTIRAYGNQAMMVPRHF